MGRSTPNPLRPPQALVTSGPFRYSRNPIMLGGWLFGGGLGVILASPSLLGLVAAIAASGVVYVRMEKPALASRFGEAWSRYAGAKAPFNSPGLSPCSISAVYAK
ncbi:MAG: methyltransferase family protein [Bryobacteraceae bacterium]